MERLVDRMIDSTKALANGMIGVGVWWTNSTNVTANGCFYCNFSIFNS